MLTLLLVACTFTPGQAGFATLRDTTLTVALVPGAARDLGDGAFLTDQGWAITPSVARVYSAELALMELRGAEGVSFDPANPPEGYTLCHGGHCHSDAGALVPYAEIEAELAGGSAEFVPLVWWALDQEAELLAPQTWPLGAPEPSADLPQATVRQLNLAAPHLWLSATAEPYPEGGEALTLTIDLPLGQDATGPLDLVIDRAQDPVLDLDLRWTLDGTLLDGLDLGALAVDGAVALTDPAQPGAATVLETWLTLAPTATVTGSR